MTSEFRLEYSQSFLRGFKVTSTLGGSAFEPLATWMRQDLHVDLTTCAITPNFKPKPIAEDIVTKVNDIGNKKGMPDITNCGSPPYMPMKLVTMTIVISPTTTGTIKKGLSKM